LLNDIDNISAAPTVAALMACPNKPETSSFISIFPVQIDALIQGASRRIEDLVLTAMC
jgi:serine protease inhibitor ecotin